MDPKLVWQRPLGYLVRHGSTEANAQNCFRGWIDFPLDEEGRQAGVALQNFFSYERIGRIICSDLSRAVDTAQYIMDCGNVCCPYLSIEPAIRPWNVGEFAGKKRTEAVEKRFEKYVDNPELVIPEGESLTQFRNRNDIIMDLLANPYEGCPNVIVAHTSNLTSVQHLANDEAIEIRPEAIDLVKPGGVVAVYLMDNKLSFVAVMGATEETAGTGVS